jgi:hypothetical protein
MGDGFQLRISRFSTILPVRLSSQISLSPLLQLHITDVLFDKAKSYDSSRRSAAGQDNRFPSQRPTRKKLAGIIEIFNQSPSFAINSRLPSCRPYPPD